MPNEVENPKNVNSIRKRDAFKKTVKRCHHKYLVSPDIYTLREFERHIYEKK